MTLKVLTTRSRRFTCIRLLWYSPDGITVPPFPVTFTTMALYHSSLRWFEASTCMAASRGPPSSSIKHGLKFPSSPSWHTTAFNACCRMVFWPSWKGVEHYGDWWCCVFRFLPPANNWLIQSFGAETGWRVWSLALLLVMLPVGWFLVRAFQLSFLRLRFIVIDNP